MDSRDIEKETRDRLAWTDLLEHLALRCHSPRAQALARAMPRIDDIDTLEATLDQVVEARDLHARSERPPFGEVHDLRPALAHLTKDGALDAETLLITAETLRSLDRLARFLQAQETHAPRLAALASRIQDLESVWGAIDDAFNPSGNLADHASHELHDRRRQVSRLKGQLGHEMKRLMDTPQIARHLQDRFITTRDDRLVLPVRADAIGAVDGIVLGSSSSGATLFVAPRELVGLNNQLKVAEFAVQQEELRILRDLSQLVAEERDTIATNSEVGVQLDLLDGRARLAIDLDAERPRLSREGHLHLRAARHPLLALSRIDVVPNDITLDAGRGLIISGP
ncbi:MAG: hypothetical protein KAI47_22720, partial [Deltaproteobacteria bacterium]|nr:hypothetical protein [Deltaproteobacteria bacterium]